MTTNFRVFIAVLIVSVILCLNFMGGFGAAQSGVINPQKDSLVNYLQPNKNLPVKILLPSIVPVCQNKVMDIVAHEDDDILFMNPDLLRGLNHGDCIQTIYVTAGDAGLGSSYWTQREHGAESAFSAMLNHQLIWQMNPAKIDGKWTINSATTNQVPNVSLIFIRLPDGNLSGDGFSTTNFESLKKLEAGQISKLQTVDTLANYDLSDLVSLISSLIKNYQPDQIRTQAEDFPDHSDHVAVSQLVSQAYKQFNLNNIAIKQMPISFYNGYPINTMPENVSDDLLKLKENVFLQYAKYDPAVCSSLDECINTSTYGGYLKRQYNNSL